MRVITTVHEMEEVRPGWGSNVQVGFVPTMGYLHEGHLALVHRARKENDVLVVSIFVNPTQFGPHEDFEKYPRNMQRDMQMLEEANVDMLFAPTTVEMYPAGFATYVEPSGSLNEQAEGGRRPGHFRGVDTIVLKLFNTVQPARAYFGQKDAQQVAVISRMITDLRVPVQLCVVPTIREADGLAMSSRNAYLRPDEREAATVLYRALLRGKAVFDERPEKRPQDVVQAMTEVVASEPRVRLDYAEVRNPETFLPLEQLQAPAVLALAAWVGTVRLIDNFFLHADGNWDTGIPVASH